MVDRNSNSVSRLITSSVFFAMLSSKFLISIELKHHPYEVVIGGQGIKSIGDELNKLGVREAVKVLVVTNPDVHRPYGEILMDSLKRSGYEPKMLILVLLD